MAPWKMWLIAAVVFLVIEILPPATSFFFLCVSLGALAASVAAVFTSIAWIPWVVFVFTTLALKPMLVPLAKFLFRKEDNDGKKE